MLKYKEEFIQELKDYFSAEPYYEAIIKKVTKDGVVQLNVEKAFDFPTLSGFAKKIGINRKTIIDWSKKYPEFGEAYEFAKDMQERFIVVNGLKGLINPTFAIFTAKNVLGWRDKHPDEVDQVNVNNNVNVDDEKLKKLIKIARGEKDDKSK